MSFKGAFFDFDLTLADATKGILKAYKKSFAHFGYPIPSDRTILETVGHTVTDSFTMMTGETSPYKKEEFFEYYLTQANVHMTANTVLFPGTKPLLSFLYEKGIKTAIISTKRRFRIDETLQRDGIKKYIDTVIGSEDVKTHKPSPEGILAALLKLGLKKEEVLYVGDHTIDAEAAQNAGVSFAAVTTGTTKKEIFEGFSPLLIVNDIYKVKEIFDE